MYRNTWDKFSSKSVRYCGIMNCSFLSEIDRGTLLYMGFCFLYWKFLHNEFLCTVSIFNFTFSATPYQLSNHFDYHYYLDVIINIVFRQASQLPPINRFPFYSFIWWEHVYPYPPNFNVTSFRYLNFLLYSYLRWCLFSMLRTHFDGLHLSEEG